MRTAEQILARAADLVERPDGWCQHRLRDRNGGVCLLGALFVAGGMMTLSGEANFSTDDADAIEARHEARVAIDKELGSTYAYSLIDWNNEPGREQVEVATALRSAKRWL